MTKRSMRWVLASLILSAAATAGWACDDQAKADDAKDKAAVAAKADAKGADMPCCAHAKEAADTKTVAAADDKPCTGHDGKGCPKKAAAVAKNDAAKDTPKAEQVADAGARR
jgi:hypothetical protein